ncbi:myomegalin-like isoform X2 [Patiria miniata]|uniref:Centrosomin N-terminal motif 1 domain-containing protein n=1 Tax=Patiria miniata TaxID=46514 RepID=A0A913Z0W0_PATMI|nr:myomegalin-like isoform X2 [Patiria miniata]
MDSVVGDDPTLPVDFEESANMAGLPDVTTGPDITAANFSDHFPDGNMPAIQKISSGRMSPIRAHTMKDYEQQISELKKENFSLKLRIYFMEERIEQNFDDDTKTNIELKVEIESLKKDLMEKQQLLIKASNAVESLAHEKEGLTDRLRQENNQALTHQRERLELALQQSQQECESVKRANEILQKRLSETKKQPAQEDKGQDTRDMQVAHQQAMQEKDREIDDLNAAVKMKEAMIAQLEAEKQYAVDEKLDPLQLEVQQLQRTLENRNAQLQAVKEDLDKEKGEGRNRDRQYEEAFKEQERRLKDLETSSENMQQELKNKDKEVKDLQNTLKKAEKEKKDLEEEADDKNKELKTLESNTMKRDKAIQGLAETIKAKDKEIRLLCDQADDRENALTQAREAMHKAQRNKYEGMEQYQAAMVDMEGKLAEQKANLHSKQRENERLQKTLARKQQELDGLRHDGNEAEQHLNDLLEQRELTIKELKGQLQDAKLNTDDKVDAIEQHYQGLLEDGQQQLQNKDKIIQRLTKGVQDKDRLVKDDNGGNSTLIQTLRERLNQRDKAVEEALEEKLQAEAAKEGEVRQLRASLRDRDRELEKAHSDNLANQDKINQLQSNLKEKEAKTRQLEEAIEADKQAHKDADDNQRRALSERDSIVQKLRQSLETNENMLNEMQVAKQRESGDAARELDEIIEQLKTRLQDKDKLLEEVLAERSQAAVANEKAAQDLLDTIKDKDNQIKELHERQNRLTANKNNVIKELQKELNDKEYSVQAAEDTLCRAEQEQAMLLSKMRAAMADKDKTIQKLIESGREKDRLFQEVQQSASRQSPSPTMMAELANLRDKNNDFKKTLREKEAALRELQSDQPDAGFMDSLRTELDNKNKLLAKAKNTIDSLQREQQAEKQNKQEMGKLRRQIIELESEVQAKQDHIDALVHAGKVKDNIIKEIRLEQASVPVRTAAMGGEDGSNQLQQILQDQMRELGRLSDALRAERQLYVNITQSGSGDREDGSQRRSSDSLTIELAAVQALRRQLEDGIKRNDAMREQLERQMNQAEHRDMSPRTAAQQSKEMQTLRHKLEDSSRWNASLQSRLDEMRQRVGGVGRDLDTDQTSGNDDQTSSPSQTSDSGQASRQTVPELQREVARLKTQLQGSEQRRMSLEDALDRQDVESLRSIPGQEEDSPSVTQANAYQKRIQELERMLAESEQQKQSAKQQLEASLLNQSRGEEEEGPVVAILKQQLDQAKTLLREKDHQLQQKEQQNQTLRHHLGIGPDSPIHPGRSMLATLHQENSRLHQDGQDLVEKNQALARQLQSLQSHFNQLQQVNSALQHQLENPPDTRSSQEDHLVPVLKNQLDQAKALIQEKDRQNQIMREILRISPDTPVEEGKEFIDKLQKRNQHLKSKLNQALQGIENMRAELESVSRELEHLKQATPRSINPEISRLQKQLRNAQNLNELLKKHIDLNSSQDSDQPQFNPELIVDMAKEIERLQDQLKEAQDKLQDAGQTQLDKGRSIMKASSSDISALKALRQELQRSQTELDELKRKYRTLQVKLQATEGTVHHQADRINRYRREMHNAGLAPPSTPKRVHSDSNLLHSSTSLVSPRRMSGISLGMFEASESSTSSPCPSERGGLDEVSFSEFGNTNNVDDLKEQIALLKNQVDRYKRIIRHLQRRLRSEERSRSPNRAPSPMSESSSSGWFELTANQDAFERLKQEVENLQAQLQETHDANGTLKNMNNQLQEQLQVIDAATASRGRCISDEMLRTQGEETELLKKQLHDSQGVCESLKSMLNEAVTAMEEVMDKHGKDSEKGSDISPSKINRVQYKMQKSRDLAEKLNRVLEEPIQGSKVSFVDVGTRPLYLDSLEAKDKEISRLKKELKDRKQLNHKLRDLLTDNQRVAEETREDLQRLSKEVEEKNEKISELHSQLRDSIRASAQRAPPSDTQHPTEVPGARRSGPRQGLFEFDEGDVDFPDFGQPSGSRERETRGSAAGQSEPISSTQRTPTVSRTVAASTQTSTYPPVSLEDTTSELARMRSKLRDVERLNSALRAELEIYKSVISDGDIGKGTGRGDGKQDPNDILKEHLEELRQLRKKLEESIRVNDRLREQLEARLAGMGQQEGVTIVHLEQTNIELTERNNSLKMKLTEKERTIRDLRGELQRAASLRVELDEKDRTIQDLRGDLQQANSLKVELTEKDATILDLRDELRRASTLRSQLSEKDRTIQDLRGELNQVRSSRVDDTEKDRTIRELRGDLKLAKREAQRHQAENQRLRDQIEENTHLAESLRFELSVYEHLHTKDDSSRTSLGGASPRLPSMKDQTTGLDLSDLLKEMRHLRIQLERSIDTNNALRLRLEEMMKTTSPKDPHKTSLTTVTMTTVSERDSWTLADGVGRTQAGRTFTPRQLFNGDASRRHVACQTSLSSQATSPLYPTDGMLQDEEYYSIPGVAPLRNHHTNSASDKTSQHYGETTRSDEGSEGDIHVIGTVPTYETLRENLHDGRIIVNLIETRLTEMIRSHPESTKDLQALSKEVHNLKSHLDRCNHQLARFWKGHLPQGDQVARLRRRLKAQDDLMKEALQRLSTSNRLKEDMELALIQQLSQTHDVLRQARGNLEAQSTTSSSTPPR